VNRIFVIDDEAAMGENIQRMLKFPDTTVTAYADPVKALADALAKPPDLVLLDMRMPGMSGEEVFARLHQAHPGLPIVFLTAFGSVEGAMLAMRNGAFDYLQKPFRREDLLLVVKRALSHAELEQEVERLKEGWRRSAKPTILRAEALSCWNWPTRPGWLPRPMPPS
jgi:FixJ family two-component response regulator